MGCRSDTPPFFLMDGLLTDGGVEPASHSRLFYPAPLARCPAPVKISRPSRVGALARSVPEGGDRRLDGLPGRDRHIALEVALLPPRRGVHDDHHEASDGLVILLGRLETATALREGAGEDRPPADVERLVTEHLLLG